MIGLVVALESEAKSVLDNMKIERQEVLAMKKCYIGKFADKDVALIISGIGKVNAGISTQIIIDKFSPKFIINFGTCGGINPSVKILTYYLIDKCLQFDFDLSELDGVPLGYIQDYDRNFFEGYKLKNSPLVHTTLATADRFTSNENDISVIDQMGCTVRDMEGCAIAQTCLANSIPILLIKGVTDVHGTGTASEQFYENLKIVCKNFPQILKKVIKQAVLEIK